jgi:hypothetical protein
MGKEYKIYALNYAGPLKSSGAFIMWNKDWDKIILFPGHGPLMSQNYPKVAEGITRLV